MKKIIFLSILVLFLPTIVFATTCEPLFEDHNDKNTDRINMILIGSDFDNMDQFKDNAKKILAIDGKPALYQIDGKLILRPNGSVIDVKYGLFAIEPFRSNIDKFNIWYFSEQARSLASAIETFCDFNFIYLVFINKDSTDIDWNYSTLPNFANQKDIVKENIIFGVSRNSLALYNNEPQYHILPHETSHALFGLIDESTSTGAYMYPNCARNQDEAKEYWGNLISQVDPFYYEYSNFMRSVEPTDYYIIPEDDVKTQYHIGGCANSLDGITGAIKPTRNSIMMNSGFAPPVFGSVNRARAEQVLNLFSGKSTKTIPLPSKDSSGNKMFWILIPGTLIVIIIAIKILKVATSK